MRTLFRPNIGFVDVLIELFLNIVSLGLIRDGGFNDGVVWIFVSFTATVEGQSN
jgi:metal-sulfur cluster biosynthetic enzyme